MNDKIVRLHSQKLAVEQRIFQLKKAGLNESRQEMMHKLEGMLVKINEAIANETSTDVISDNVEEADGHIDPSTYNQYPDHEVQMARGDLYRTAKHAIMLHEILQRLDEKQGLEGWVQAKITKAADYIETVWHYLAYEMRFPYDEQGYKHDESVEEAVTAYGPGEDPNAAQQAPGAPKQDPNQAKPGQMSPTPPAGGSTPGGGTPGMVKMAKLGQDKKPQGTPIMVRATDIATKQKAGYFVIGENASAGASSAGGIASSMGNGTGFANGGIGMQRRKKKKTDEGMNASTIRHKQKLSHMTDKEFADHPHYSAMSDDKLRSLAWSHGYGGPGKPGHDHYVNRRNKGKTATESTMTDAEKEARGPKFTGYWKGKDKGRPGNKMVGGD